MNHLTLMRVQSILPFRNNKKRIKSIPHSDLPLSNSGGRINRISLRSIPSDHRSRNLDQSEKVMPHVAAIAANRSKTAEAGLMMHITVDASCVTQLRHLVMGTCGDLVEFMRIQPIAHAKKMKVWLCLSKAAVALIMDAVMRSLPSAEFGRITQA